MTVAIEVYMRGAPTASVMLRELFGELDAEREVSKLLAKAAKLAIQNFNRNDVSGNFLGDDDHEAWRELSAALAKYREGM